MTIWQFAFGAIFVIAIAVPVLAIYLKNIHIWILGYLKSLLRQRRLRAVPVKHIYLCVADHDEPYNEGADKETADRRVEEHESIRTVRAIIRV